METISYHDAELILGDAVEALASLPPKQFQCCITSPPYYGTRDYQHPGQIGAEETVDDYIERLVAVFREVRRVLRDDGTLWVVMGDVYAGSTQFKGQVKVKGQVLRRKDLVGLPWRLAFALQRDGWILRSDVVWHKGNCIPTSAGDRCTVSHEYVFLLSKKDRYFYNKRAILEPLVCAPHPPRNIKTARIGQNERTGGVAEPERVWGDEAGRNKRTVWKINTRPVPGFKSATFPLELAETCLLAGSKPGDRVLDPFNGSGTTGIAALRLGRSYCGIELVREHVDLTLRRLSAGKTGVQIEAEVEIVESEAECVGA